jgi:peptidoglycan hydrolase-like protein with peptidoglycan-binding domain
MSIHKRFMHAALAMTFAGALTVFPAVAATHTNQSSYNRGYIHGTYHSTLKMVQRNLRAHGFYHGKIDGLMGPQTRSAIYHYQRANNLKANGHLDNQTRSKLGLKRG